MKLMPARKIRKGIITLSAYGDFFVRNRHMSFFYPEKAKTGARSLPNYRLWFK
jgi:hypothetical protein